jgi:homoserine acetyltransferase
MGGFLEDIADMRVVVQHLVAEFGYKVDLVVGHSRGSVAALSWMCDSDEGRNVRGFVNVSGRYRMNASPSSSYTSSVR